MYDEMMVAPMRKEVVDMGAVEMRSAAEVDAQLKDCQEPTLVFVNSVCGCAAGGARPGLKLALQADKKPGRITTVFAGQDREATARAREYFVGYMPSSPQIALIKGGRCVAMMERHDIEGRMPIEIANKLVDLFNKHC
ncbi:MAG: BrxA/BrxB family bacilliredoxin [Planctomycetes bacterium]|nr:BrxA/BrxB family bacilliredoxin [Planctomycetota bacterium]